MKTKVLIIYSVYDSVTERRIELLKSSPQTEMLELDFVFATKDLDEDITINELVFRIKLQIKSFKPDFIVFHTGAAFYEQPAIFRESVLVLIQEFPQIKYCYEPKAIYECKHYFDTIDKFDKSERAAEIVYLLFFKILNRKLPTKSWIQLQQQ